MQGRDCMLVSLFYWFIRFTHNESRKRRHKRVQGEEPLRQPLGGCTGVGKASNVGV